jgi:hypothetical protein
LIQSERKKDGEKVTETIPEAARYYTTQGMGSVDRLNQTLRNYDWEHKNYSWRSCHFHTLFRFALANSWIIYKHFNGVLSFAKFLQVLKQEFKEQFKEGEEKKKNDFKKRKLQRQEERRNEKRQKKTQINKKN